MRVHNPDGKSPRKFKCTSNGRPVNQEPDDPPVPEKPLWLQAILVVILVLSLPLWLLAGLFTVAGFSGYSRSKK